VAPCLGHRVTWTATLLIDSRDAKVDGIDQLGDPFGNVFRGSQL
jgi:hypothetical protein